MKVISSKVLPMRSPVLATACWITIAHYWGFPGWLWGVLGVFIALGWVGYIYGLCVGEPYIPK